MDSSNFMFNVSIKDLELYLKATSISECYCFSWMHPMTKDHLLLTSDPESVIANEIDYKLVLSVNFNLVVDHHIFSCKKSEAGILLVPQYMQQKNKCLYPDKIYLVEGPTVNNAQYQLATNKYPLLASLTVNTTEVVVNYFHQIFKNNIYKRHSWEIKKTIMA